MGWTVSIGKQSCVGYAGAVTSKAKRGNGNLRCTIHCSVHKTYSDASVFNMIVIGAECIDLCRKIIRQVFRN